MEQVEIAVQEAVRALVLQCIEAKIPIIVVVVDPINQKVEVSSNAEQNRR